MKRAVLAAILFVGCRTIVGIEDLDTPPPQQQQPPRQDGGDPGQRDTGAPPVQISKASQDKIDACVAKGRDCRKCCKDPGGFEQLHRFEDPGPGKDCMCEPDLCESKCSECATGDRLGNVPGASGGPPECIICLDERLRTDPAPACAREVCGNDEGCVAGLACLRACGGGGGP